MIQKTIGIHIGALCDPIATQLKKQGFKYSEKECKRFQSQVEAMLTLRFGDLLTDKMKDAITKKLYKKIVSHVCKMNKLKKNA